MVSSVLPIDDEDDRLRIRESALRAAGSLLVDAAASATANMERVRQVRAAGAA